MSHGVAAGLLAGGRARASTHGAPSSWLDRGARMAGLGFAGRRYPPATRTVTALARATEAVLNIALHGGALSSELGTEVLLGVSPAGPSIPAATCLLRRLRSPAEVFARVPDALELLGGVGAARAAFPDDLIT